MKKYELVAIDIDGTLLDNDEQISKENIDAINRCEKNGVKVCICTGRNVRNTIKIAKKLKTGAPFVCSDGAIFYDTKKNKVIVEKKFSKETLEKLVRIANEFNLYMEFNTRSKYIKYVKNVELEKFSYGEVAKTLKQRLSHYFIKRVRYVKNIDIFLIENKNDINQFLIGGDEEEVEKFKEKISGVEFEDVDIRYDLWENYIFVVCKGCTKAHGLDILSEHFNVSIENMIAIGDQMNDIDMIKRAGLGVAMGNAHEEIKKNANVVTKTNLESGVAYAINKYIFGE